jgi:hypothetical protein
MIENVILKPRYPVGRLCPESGFLYCNVPAFRSRRTYQENVVWCGKCLLGCCSWWTRRDSVLLFLAVPQAKCVSVSSVQLQQCITSQTHNKWTKLCAEAYAVLIRVGEVGVSMIINCWYNYDLTLFRNKVFTDKISLTNDPYFDSLYHPWKFVGVVRFHSLHLTVIKRQILPSSYTIHFW